MERGREEHQLRGAGPLKKKVPLTGNNREVRAELREDLMYDLYNKGLAGNVLQPSIYDISQQALEMTIMEDAP